jgi:CMP-N-acetylneuraminic acid synthetase
MKNIKDIVFILSVRLNSTRVAQKMIRKFSDTTLLDIAISKILNSSIIPQNQFYVTTCEEPIINICNKYNVNIFRRSMKSANGDGTLKPSEIADWIGHHILKINTNMGWNLMDVYHC